jgi:two-component system sensor histidine kinase KdpD
MDSSRDSVTTGTVLVWVDDYPSALPLLRMGKRKARELNTSWETVHVDTTSDRADSDSTEARQALHILTLAEQMGAKTTHIIARSAREGVARLIAERNQNGNPIMKLVIAKREPHGWQRWFGKPDIEFFNELKNIPLKVFAVEGPEEVLSSPGWLHIFKVSLIEIINCIMAVAVATAIIQMIDLVIPAAITSRDYNKPIIYMIACAFAAGRYGLFCGVFTAVISFIIFNVMYVSPNMHLAINDATDAVNLGLYLAAALVISFFTSQTFTQREQYAARAQRTHALFQLHRVAMDYRTRSEAVEALHRELTSILETEVAFFLPVALNPSQIELFYPSDLVISDSDNAAMQASWQESKVTGVGSPYFNEVGWRFVPLITSQGEVGVLGMKIDDIKRFDIPSGRLLSAIADQAALIIERFELGQQMEESRLRDEREKLRSMLLSSVSHDLKTPLASVIGALSVYQTMGTNLSEEHRVTLITTALEEAQRLDSFITNILDMTRLESGDIDFRKEWTSPENTFRKVERRMKMRLRNHKLSLTTAESNSEILIDPTSLEQVLQNLLDNAAKYTPPETAVEVRAFPQGKHYVIEVRDHGDGIPANKLATIFDKYARLKKTDSQVAGTGLGLSICKSMLQAQGGSIEATNHPDGGAQFTLTFPQWRRIRDAKEDAA